MNAEEYIKDKGIIKEGNHNFVVTFSDGRDSVNIGDLLENYATIKLENQKEETKEWLIGEDFEGLAEKL